MNGTYVPFLCFDPSTRMGWALWNCDDRKVHFGTWDLGKSGDHGEYFVNWMGRIEALLKDLDMERDLRLTFAVEAPVPSPERTAISLGLSNKWIGVLEYWCKLRGFARPIPVQLISWRNYFLRRTKPKNLAGPDATRWYKEEVIRVCNAMNLHPRNDNEADALGILKYMKDGGSEAMERLHAQRKREAQNKRAQKSLNLEGPQ